MSADDETATVVERHLDAVRSGDPQRMAADYADGALLRRGAEQHVGRTAIAAYFTTVPIRLGGGVVEFDAVEVDGETAEVHWHIVGGPSTGVRGIDTYRVRDGLIQHQEVALAGGDF